MNGKNRFLTTLAALTLVCALLLALWLVPLMQVAELAQDADAQNIADLENKYRATMVQILGGLAVLIGAVWGWRGLQLERDRQRGERFSHSIGQLGNESMVVRLSGLHMLKVLASTSKSYSWPTVEALAAFIRLRRDVTKASPTVMAHEVAPERNPGKVNPVVVAHPPYVATLDTDVQLALDILGQVSGKSTPGQRRLDLSAVNLERASFREGSFSDADFTGSSLVLADFVGADLRGASITGRSHDGKVGTEAAWADFTNSDLRDSNMSLAYFQHAEFSDANLRGADLEGANMRGATGLTLVQLKQARNWEYACDTVELKSEKAPR